MTTKIKTLKPVKSRVVSAEEYQTLIDKRRDNIESSRFIPPKIGGKGFGKFQVTFKDKACLEIL